MPRPVRFTVEDGFITSISTNSVTRRETWEYVSPEDAQEMLAELTHCLLEVADV